MKAETYGVVAQLIVLSVLLAIYVYVAITSQKLIQSLQSMHDSLDPQRDAKERAVIENEMKLYWVLNGVAVVLSAVSILNMLIVLFSLVSDGSKGSSGPQRKKPKSAKL